ncbi:putative DNA exonuclease [Vibrio phage vB_VpaP_G1]|uniref:DNA exonuclease n=1 Tax=Vibrio phage vB_VpaP_G1 TaxID=2862773 RepID=A0AAE7WUR5_9CAUD|nr:putative DNA exonuclease [Vibrio phage vB_VpaP_G1]QYW05838.1 putative DNA exonuclease [Vibrio phage vB_VpaP_G1]
MLLGQKVTEFVSVATAKALGDFLANAPALKQVGVIRTEYRHKDGSVRGRSIEAVVLDGTEAKLYAVEQHRGVAIIAEIRDTDMRNTMLAEIASFNEDSENTFIYDQIITEGVEEFDGKGLDMSEVVDVNDGTEDLNA